MNKLLPLLCALAMTGQAASFGAKPYGVVLLGEGGGPEWAATSAEIIKAMGRERPTFFAEGEADAKSIQKAVDQLTAQRVEKIVVLPLFITTFSDVMDQTRYLLGIRETPLTGQSGRRVKSKAPIVLAKALDDHPIIVEILASRAVALSREPERDTLVLIGQAPEDKEAASQWVATVTSLAEKVAKKAGLRAGQAMALRDGQRSDKRGKAEDEVKAALKALRKQGGVVVVPLELSKGLISQRLPKVLEGVMVHYNGRAVLPDARLTLWAEQTVTETAQLPDMKVYKNETLAKPKGLSQPTKLNTKPSFTTQKGDLR